jgi:hypothetical protein
MDFERSDAELAGALEALLLELVRRVDQRVQTASKNIVAGDELFVFIGQIDAALRATSEHLRAVRESLDSAARQDR